MPRKPRLDAPGTIHHVMVRGIEQRSIFVDDVDRGDLLDRLCLVLPECDASCLAWAFLSNHAHYAIRVGSTPLAQVMRRVNTGYAVRFNRRHERVGYLFQNRYGSEIVGDDAYLLKLIPYVLLNPLRAGLVEDLRALESFPWSSYGALMGRRAPLPFEDADAALAPFGDLREIARHQLWVAMRDEDCAGVVEPTVGAMLSPRTFLDCARRPLPDDEELLAMAEAVCEHLGVFLYDVERGMRHDAASRARAVICHIAVSLWHLPRVRVARLVCVSSSAVSHALARGAQILRDDPSLREAVQQFTTVPVS